MTAVKHNPQIHHRRSGRLKGYDYTQAGAYFVTIATQGRACLFGEVRDGEMRLSAVGKIVQWEWMRLEEKFSHVELGACVVMPNHIHGIIVIHGAERSPRHGTAEPNAEPHVGATQAGQPGRISGLAIPSNMDTSGTDGSPRHGSTNVPDMEIPAVDGDPDGPGWATRHEQNLTIDGNVGLPDEAVKDIGGSPLRGPGGPPPHSLGAIIGQWKSRVTKRAWKLPGMHGTPIWQRNYYEHIIRDEADLRRIEEYIQNNPRLWEQDQLHPQAAPNKFNQDR